MNVPDTFKAKIKTDLIEYETYGGVGVGGRMLELKGKIVPMKKEDKVVTLETYRTCIAPKYDCFYWSKEMFEPVVEIKF